MDHLKATLDEALAQRNYDEAAHTWHPIYKARFSGKVLKELMISYLLYYVLNSTSSGKYKQSAFI